MCCKKKVKCFFVSAHKKCTEIALNYEKNMYKVKYFKTTLFK